MDYYRCENADCGFITDDPNLDTCPDCGSMLMPVEEHDLTGQEWAALGHQALERNEDVLAVERFRRAAELNDPWAITNLGWCYECGRGLEENPAEAVKYYRRAAELGYHPALCNLGVCLLNGVGVPADEPL